MQIVWKNVFLISLIHVLALVGLFWSFLYVKWMTILTSYVVTLLASLLGITAGAHRLWSHRSYNARLPLRIMLMLANTMAMQNDIYEWCRDHRAHHKFSETNADPHNSNRGFFFAHMGWLMCRKHPQVLAKGIQCSLTTMNLIPTFPTGKTISLSDLEDDPVVMFQRKYYKVLVVLCWAIIPTVVPYLLWNENPVHAFLTCVCFRYVYALHSTWLVNSAAHMYGNRPYDRNIEPRENELVIFASFGEGYHNFHHTFPWNYSTSEFGWIYNFNFTTMWIDFFALIGQVNGRKTVPPTVIANRVQRTGDHVVYHRNALVHQMLGLVVGTWAIWFPTSIRITYNLICGYPVLR